ncbi:MAG: RluA family pseudouridine synthase [Proteobacteria bacterium]|nr:RluA family pseudouridine synthase [Pseudomonadota bacterium]
MNISAQNSPENQEHIVTADDAGQRLDKTLQKLFPAITFGMVQTLCRKGQIRLDGKRVKGNERLEEGQRLRIPPQIRVAVPTVREQVDLRPTDAEKKVLKNGVLYEDEHYIILNKPAGMPVQAGSGHVRSLDRLAPLVFRDGDLRLTHRLDKETSGCLVLARSARAASAIAKMFRDHEVQKTYWAVAVGDMYDSKGTIDFALLKSGAPGQQRVIAHADGVDAETDYRRLARSGDLNWLELMPKTGRTHQIRAHLSAFGVPILGDGKYGGDDLCRYGEEKIKNLYLHARRIQFIHPETGQEIDVTAGVPEHFARMFDRLHWQERKK